MAKAGFGNPKAKKGKKEYLCPKCGGVLTSVKSGGKMGLTCNNKIELLSKPVDSVFTTDADWTKDHRNFDAGCDVYFKKNEFSSLSTKE